ncbi:diacylglycerol kinase family lipid kinase [bacterium]|nr:diacylglycerol kinase family lipid kinase [bacterium]
MRKVRALYNPRSGFFTNQEGVRSALEENWDIEGIDLTLQLSKNAEDGIAKAKRAIEDGVDTIIVAGGDGMVNSIGSALLGTDTALAVIPTGSGNGFARHFNIPLNPAKAAAALKRGKRQKIDVGLMNGRPFFVTCSLAWDAELAKGFKDSPVRGVIPYFFAGISGYFTYNPQNLQLEIDGEKLDLHEPMLFTVANLTQFGGGAKIAPNAQPDDGELVLVTVPYIEPVKLLGQLFRLFDGSISKVPEISMRSFKQMKVVREGSQSIQMDGELVPAGSEIEIIVDPMALNLILPDL